MDSQEVTKALSHIIIKANPNNEPVTITGSSDTFQCIGIGTDAAVFRSVDSPHIAFKVYAVERLFKKEMELEVYQTLGESQYFSRLYGEGDRFLVLSYEHGTTLYDCLLQGIYIPKQVILDVEDARSYIRSKGLNPRDIHLKNILLQNGRGKIIDVSEYCRPGNDYRWEHLKRGYEEYYHIIDGRPIPYWVLETTRKWYNQTNTQPFSFEEFMKKVSRLALFWR